MLDIEQEKNRALLKIKAQRISQLAKRKHIAQMALQLCINNAGKFASYDEAISYAKQLLKHHDNYIGEKHVR